MIVSSVLFQAGVDEFVLLLEKPTEYTNCQMPPQMVALPERESSLFFFEDVVSCLFAGDPHVA